MKNQKTLLVASKGLAWAFRLAFVSLLFSCMNPIFAEEDSNALKTRILSDVDSSGIKCFLHPMPQELRLGDVAYEISAAQCALRNSSTMLARESQVITDFKARWLGKRGSALKESGGQLTIIAGLVENSEILREASEKGVFDPKYLLSRPNPEQAYVLNTVAEKDKIIVYVAANAPSGLYYGLLTLEQLFDGFSNTSDLVLPKCKIVDWPDIRWRGTWTLFGGNKKNYEPFLRRFSELKLNFVETMPLRPNKYDENGQLKVVWSMAPESIEIAKRYMVKHYPGSSHIPHLLGRYKNLSKSFPGAKGKPIDPNSKTAGPCCAHPDTAKYFDQYLASTAKQFDFADIWLTEFHGATGVCHCDKCRGDTEKCFINETKLFMDAYRKAKKINPNFKIMLGLSQGSYPHNLEMLKHIPKDVILNFYHGGVTYATTFQQYNLPPSVQEMKRLGYTVGSTPSPAPWQIFHPFQTPQYVRLLCGEAGDRGMEFVLAFFWPNLFFWDLNSECMAEFLWNCKGRTAKEFTVAWATRKGLKDPEETAAVISMMEYPERGFYNCKFDFIFPEIVKFAIGKERANYSILRGFEFKNHEEINRVLKICEEATIRAAKLENPQLLASCELMKCLFTVLDQYTSCVEGEKSPKAIEGAKKTIKKQLELYPKLFYKWLATKNPSKYANTFVKRLFDRVFTKPAIELKKSASPAMKRLLEAEKQGKLTVIKLNTNWRFQPSANDLGLTDKWYASDFNDSKWPEIKAGQGYGWEKQGYDGYLGHAWYRQKLDLPENLNNKKHLYLLFKGVDEDGEIFINGEKAFTHDYKTVGCHPAHTWDKPFSFDAKSALKPGGDNSIAVRVFNRFSMGGIWKPVFLIATDQTAETGDLSAMTVANP